MMGRRLIEAELAELRQMLEGHIEGERVRRARLEDVVVDIKAWKQQAGSLGSDNMSRLLDALEAYLEVPPQRTG
jgi:hypothetical protein